MKSQSGPNILLIALWLLMSGCAKDQSGEQSTDPLAVPLSGKPATAVVEPFDTQQPAQATLVPTRQVLEQIPLNYATPDNVGVVSSWSPPPYPAPLALRPDDHFYFHRPLASDADTWLHPSYRYGNTHFGEEPTHTGIDIVTDMWTPVLATADGVVVWVGYGLYRGIEDETDPYGLAVAIEHTFGYQGQRIFTVYGHLSSAEVVRGQRVDTGQVIGKVGNTGEASGPHLHYEVRLGENRYFHTYNPELWMVPLEGTGVLAGRIMDSQGRELIEYPIHIFNLDTTIETEVWTYAKEAVHSDPVYQENVVVGDLPAGPYEVYINYVGHKFAAQIYLKPGQTNLITFNGRDGFEIEE